MISTLPKYVVLPIKDIVAEFEKETQGMLDAPVLNFVIDALSVVSDDDSSSSEAFNHIELIKRDLRKNYPEEIVMNVTSSFYDLAVNMRELLEEHKLYDNPDRVIDYVFKETNLGALVLERWDEETMAEE